MILVGLSSSLIYEAYALARPHTIERMLMPHTAAKFKSFTSCALQNASFMLLLALPSLLADIVPHFSHESLPKHHSRYDGFFMIGLMTMIFFAYYFILHAFTAANSFLYIFYFYALFAKSVARLSFALPTYRI